MAAASCYLALGTLAVASHSFVEESCAFEKVGLVLGLVVVAAAAVELLDVVARIYFERGLRDPHPRQDWEEEVDLALRA